MVDAENEVEPKHRDIDILAAFRKKGRKTASKGKRDIVEIKLTPQDKKKWEDHAMSHLKSKKGDWIRESEVERVVTNENKNFKAMAENAGRSNNMGRDAAGILKRLAKEGKIETDKINGQRVYTFVDKD